MSDAKTKVPSYRGKDSAILPLPAFVTVEVPDQEERQVDDQVGRQRRTFEDWQLDMTANQNKMAADDRHKRDNISRR